MPKEKVMNQNISQTKLVITIVIITIVASVLVWYWNSVPKEEVMENQEMAETEAMAPDVQDLGEEIFEEVENSIESVIPETEPVAPNPLEGVYKNPFE